MPLYKLLNDLEYEVLKLVECYKLNTDEYQDGKYIKKIFFVPTRKPGHDFLTHCVTKFFHAVKSQPAFASQESSPQSLAEIVATAIKDKEYIEKATTTPSGTILFKLKQRIFAIDLDAFQAKRFPSHIPAFQKHMGADSPKILCPLCLVRISPGRGFRNHLTSSAHNIKGQGMVDIIAKYDPSSSSQDPSLKKKRPLDENPAPSPFLKKAKTEISCIPSHPTIQAAYLGDLEKLKALNAANELDIHARDANGSNAFHWAAGEGHLAAFEFLVQIGGKEHTLIASDNATNKAFKKNGRMAIHWAARNGRLAVFAYCVDHCQNDINQPTYDGTTPLHLALWQGHTDLAKYIITNTLPALHHTNKYGCNVFHWVALNKHDNIDTLHWLIDRVIESLFTGDLKTAEKARRIFLPPPDCEIQHHHTDALGPVGEKLIAFLLSQNDQAHTPYHKAAWIGNLRITTYYINLIKRLKREDIFLQRDNEGFLAQDLSRLNHQHKVHDLIDSCTSAS